MVEESQRQNNMPTKSKTKSFRLPNALAKRVATVAKANDPRVSANALVVSFVSSGLAADEAKKGGAK